MTLTVLDYFIIGSFFVISILIGAVASRHAGKSFSEYFLAGGKMSWWMLGISMVATTFAADTPNLVTNIVRKNGVSGNWVWWAFLLTGLLTVFVYARLWKRSGVLTDLEFYEIRYSGKAASFLRGFRAIYLGVVFNCVVMANVILAGIKLGGVLLGASPLQVVFIAGTVTVIYTLLGGLRGVILTDCFQFIVAMVGAIAAAVVVCDLPQVGGFDKLLVHDNVSGKLGLLPDFSNVNALVPLLIIPLAVQWWSSWYPVTIGRWSTVALMVLGSLLALCLESAMDGFGIILQIGAGTGLIYILRWFWWRINAFTEITGLAVSFAVAVFFQFGYSLTGLPELEAWQQLVIGVSFTTLIWLLVTILSPPTDEKTLVRFYECIQPGGVGWKPIRDRLAEDGQQLEPRDSITTGLKAMFASTFLVYALLFGTGYFLYGNWIAFASSLGVAVAAGIVLFRTWPDLRLA